ncbi:hypothetical protein HJFPF1_07003 [Paramyrothecium foliicola]|nr:hypothetical protein HJFPF1_07003 [Paramyrothecium foliicola]
MSVEIESWISQLPPLSFRARGQRTVPGPFGTPRKPSISNSYDSTLLLSGLRTPPVDDMSTAYQPPMAAYGNHGIHNYPQTLASSRPRPVVNEPRSSQHYRHSQQPQTQQSLFPHQAQPAAVAAQARNMPASIPTQLLPGSNHTTRPSTPTSDASATLTSQTVTASRRGSDSLVFHSLQIPKCISATGGNLAEFAAQMTCLFWFQSVDDLKQAENIRSRPSNAPIPRLPALAKPYEQFRKWVYSVLSTTQVTQNVILLALLFIYRLKMSTPQIKGRAGSEYRLLTVALMLGNKFLDDNTYTNKTWAEVSCFAVQEIHVMEVEFLSNMRYNLLASEAEWEEWLVKLAHFHEYYDRALRLPASPLRITSPVTKNFNNSPISSPTGASMPSAADLLPITPSAAANFSPSSSQSHNWSAYQANAISPLAAKPTMEFPASRKRSVEDDSLEHPAKRVAPPRLAQVPAAGMTARPNGPAEVARLPVPPQLTLITNQQPQGHPALYSTPNGYPTSVSVPNQGLVSLPPLQPGVRAMSTVYQPPVTGLAQQTPAAGPMGPSLPSTNYPAATIPSHPQLGFGTPSKHQSPAPLAAFGSSPMIEHFGPASGVHTPISHTPMANSPSVYLQQRNSPYKPIRHVNTLLYPPPSASLDQYHLSVPVQPTQMHYQPLGRRNDLRTGVVPEFVMYNRAQHMPLPSQGPPQGHFGP